MRSAPTERRRGVRRPTTNVLTILTAREVCEGKRVLERRRGRFAPPRRAHHATPHHANCAILKNLVLDPDSEFRRRKILQKARKQIFYSQRRCFTDDYARSAPSWTSADDLRGSWNNSRFRVKDNALLMQFPVNNIETGAEGVPHNKNSIIGIGKQSSGQQQQQQQQYLYLIDVDTGHLWHREPLVGRSFSAHTSFWKEIEWNNPNESICLRSVLRPLRSRSANGGGVVRPPITSEDRRRLPDGSLGTASHAALDVFVALALYKVQPLQPIALFSLSESSFRDPPTSASVQDDVLLTTHRHGTVQLRSVLEILRQNPRASRFDHLSVPCQIGVMPPALFSISTKDQFLTLGGFPWHVLVQADKRPTDTKPGHKYALVDIESERTTAHLGTTTSQTKWEHALQGGDDLVVGFRDELKEVLFQGLDRLQIFEFESSESSFGEPSLRLKPKYALTPRKVIAFDGKANGDADDDGKDGIDDDDASYSSAVVVTKSGRRVRQKVRFDWGECWFYSAGYEDELCLSYVVFVDRSGLDAIRGDHGGGDRGGAVARSSKVWRDDKEDLPKEAAFLCLLDGDTGAVLKKIPIPSWENGAKENQVELDLTTIVHTVRFWDGRNKVVLYELFRPPGEEEEEEEEGGDDDPSSTGNSGKRSVPRDRRRLARADAAEELLLQF